MFLHLKVMRPSAVVLSNCENLEHRYKEVTSPMSAYPGRLKVAKFKKKCETNLSWKYVLDNLRISV